MMFKKFIIAALLLVIITNVTAGTAVYANEIGLGAALRLELDSPDMLPLRTVAEALGADVGWDSDTRTAIVTRGDLTLAIPIDESLPGGYIEIIDGRTFVPAVFIIHELAAYSEWNEETRTVYIYDWSQEEQAITPEFEPSELLPAGPVTDPIAAGPSAYELLERANQAHIDAGSALMSIENTMSAEIAGVAMEIRQSGIIAQAIHSEYDIDMRMEMTTTALGTETTIVSYFRDGTLYMNLMDEWISMEIPLQAILAQAGIVTFPEEAVAAQRAAVTDTGYELTMSLSGSAMDDFVSVVLAAFEGMGLALGEIEMNIGDITLVSALDENGVLRSMDMQMTITAEMGGIATSMSIDTRTEIIQAGNVTIDFPEDMQ